MAWNKPKNTAGAQKQLRLGENTGTELFSSHSVTLMVLAHLHPVCQSEESLKLTTILPCDGILHI